MRLSLWLVLIFAFSVGMCCAVAVRSLYFEAVPIAVQSSEPTTKILVAKQSIPIGTEITADFLVFQDVAASEVPQGALSRFAQAYRRQPAYAIPEGCPICEDLLAPPVESREQNTFLPAGSQFVTLDVVQVRQGNKIFPSQDLNSGVLAADQLIDLRLVPRNEIHGTLAEKKNEVLRAYTATDLQNEGELLLDNIPIQQVQSHYSGHVTSEKIVLVLEKDQAARLSEAAKQGQIRILMSEESDRLETQADAIASVAEDRDPFDKEDSLSQHTPSVVSPTETATETVPKDVPLIAGMPSPVVVTEPEIAAAPAAVESVPSETIVKQIEVKQIAIAKKTEPSSVMPPSIPSEALSAPVSDLTSLSPKTENTEAVPLAANVSSDVAIKNNVPELVVKEKIRNDSSILVFGTPSIRVLSERSHVTKPVQKSMPSLPTVETEELNPHSFLDARLESFPGSPLMSPLLPSPAAATTAAMDYPKEAAAVRSESLSPPLSLTHTMPSVSPPVSDTAQDKMSGYSPFERRVYTVPSGEDSVDFPITLSAPEPLQSSTESDEE